MTDKKMEESKLDKLSNLIHYIVWKCQDNPSTLGSTKLNKILWHCDTVAYKDLGKPITQTEYKKLQHGPVPKFEFLKNAENSLEKQGKIISYINDSGQYQQKQFVAKTRPDISDFTAEQISIIDEIIYQIARKTASVASEETHQNFWWNSLKIGDEIPNYCIFAKPAEINLEDVVWASEQQV